MHNFIIGIELAGLLVHIALTVSGIQAYPDTAGSLINSSPICNTYYKRVWSNDLEYGVNACSDV